MQQGQLLGLFVGCLCFREEVGLRVDEVCLNGLRQGLGFSFVFPKKFKVIVLYSNV